MSRFTEGTILNREEYDDYIAKAQAQLVEGGMAYPQGAAKVSANIMFGLPSFKVGVPVKIGHEYVFADSPLHPNHQIWKELVELEKTASYELIAYLSATFTAVDQLRLKINELDEQGGKL